MTLTASPRRLQRPSRRRPQRPPRPQRPQRPQRALVAAHRGRETAAPRPPRGLPREPRVDRDLPIREVKTSTVS